MAERFSDQLTRRVAALISAEAPDVSALKETLQQLSERFHTQQNLLDRVIRISDGFQRVERERNANYQEHYEREVRRIEKLIRISDSYQAILRGSETQYREIYNYAPLAFLVLDREGHIEDWNRAAERIFGWRREEVLGKDLFELLVPTQDRQNLSSLWATTLRDRTATHSININLTRFGELITCEWNNVLRYGPDGELTGILSLGVDISDRLRLEQDLRQAKEAAEQALEDQRHFLAMASHEFRSPLAVVDSAAQLLELKFQSDEDTARIIQRIRRAVRRLSGFLEDCLTEDRLDTQHWSLAGERFALPQFLRAVVEQAQHMTPNHQILFVENDPPDFFFGDPPLLRVMLHNLIENAIKYSPAGGQITVVASTSGGGNLLLSVNDQGIGIPQEDQGRIFSKYFRGQVGGGVSGAGLGLYLVARIAALHKGRVTVDSQPGQGSTFGVLLPAMTDVDMAVGGEILK